MRSTPTIPKHPALQVPFSILLIFALILFSGLAVLVFWPWPETLRPRDMLAPINSVLAAAGCFLLSRRWLASFDASAIAGAVYGFGPFVLSFKIYHPVAGLSVALLPWLFCPLALWKRYAPSTMRHQSKQVILMLFPFVCLILFFWLPAQSWTGPYDLMPRTQQFHTTDLFTLLGFQSPEGNRIIIGLYANAFVLAVMGLFVYLAVLRVAMLIPVLAGIALSFFQPIFHVPPVIWLAVPMLFLSLLAGLGAQAFAWAGISDRKWIFFCMLIAVLLGGICLLKAFTSQSENLFRLSASMYGTAWLMTIAAFFLAKGNLRWLLFRWILIAAAVGVDILFTGRLLLTSLS